MSFDDMWKYLEPVSFVDQLGEMTNSVPHDFCHYSAHDPQKRVGEESWLGGRAST